MKAHALPVRRIEIHLKLAREQKEHIECRVLMPDHQLAITIFPDGAKFGHLAERALTETVEQLKSPETFCNGLTHALLTSHHTLPQLSVERVDFAERPCY